MLRTGVFVIVVLGLGGVATADKADLQREIEAQTAAAADLKALDTPRAATAELGELEVWLRDAGDRLRTSGEDVVRGILNRCLAQAELIRQVVAAGKLKAQVRDRKHALDESRRRIQELEKAMRDALDRKTALEAKK